MFTVILLALLPVQESLQLPAILQEDVAVSEAWLTGIHQADLAARRASAEVILEALPHVDEREQAVFLLSVAGQGNFPGELAVSMHRLREDWKDFVGFVQKSIRASAEEQLFLVKGALFAAGILELSSPTTVESIAGRLNDSSTANFSRQALLRITQQEFSDWEQFGVWWEEAREEGRETWLRTASNEYRSLILQLWKQRLLSNPSDALLAIFAPIGGVRRLGYETMRSLESTSSEGQEGAEVQALRMAYQAEHSAELRQQLVSLIPRFLQGEDAMALLDQSLESSFPLERLEAAQVLQLIRPAEVALRGLIRGLGRAYLQDTVQKGASEEFRMALWTGLIGVSRELPTLREQLVGTTVNTILLNALEFEQYPAAREKVYEASGALGGTDFHPVLLPHVLQEERSLADRRSALEALTSIALASGNSTPVLEVLGQLLSHPEKDLRYRAILCFRRLKNPEGLVELLPRLGVESEEFLILEILKSLSADSLPGALSVLLKFTVTDGTRADFATALQSQVGGSSQALTVALKALEEREAWAFSLSLLETFSMDLVQEEQKSWVEKAHAKALASWLITAGDDLTDDSRVQDALARLLEMQEKYPEEKDWVQLHKALSGS